MPSSTESAIITEITEFTQIRRTNDQNLTVVQIVIICIISGVYSRMASSHLIWALLLLFLLAQSSESVNARCLYEIHYHGKYFGKTLFEMLPMKYGHCPNSF